MGPRESERNETTMGRNIRMHRRDFMGRTLAAGLALSAGTPGISGAASGKEDKVSETSTEHPAIVDTHQHLWDLSRFRLAWLSGAPAINRSFVMKDYQEATAGLNVRKTVYMEVDVEPSQQVEEAEYVIDLCQRHDNPMAAA